MRLRENATLIADTQDNESDYREELKVDEIEREAEIAEWDQSPEWEAIESYEVNEPEDDPLGLGPLYDM